LAELLDIRELSVGLRATEPDQLVLNHLELKMGMGESVGIEGPSGSGKTTLLRAILRLLPRGASLSGLVVYKGINLAGLPIEVMRQYRGREISYIPQEPSIALNPVLRIRTQIGEIFRAHGLADSTGELLAYFFGKEAARVGASYPHQLSGGERQRIVICQAIACRPSVLLADEPTSALDSVAQREFLSLLLRLRGEHSLNLLFVSHNRAVLRVIADRVYRLSEGKLRPC
jgi:ABC-type glutathione transport system ATPase component